MVGSYVVDLIATLWYIPQQLASKARWGPLAQLVEQLTLNQQVTGSSPVRLILGVNERLL